MLKGLKVLFSSGLIMQPMVLIGVVLGAIFAYKLDEDMIWLTFSNPGYYMLAAAAAIAFTMFFKVVFKFGGSVIDWNETFLAVLGNFARLVLSNILALVFFYTLIF